MTIAAVIPCRDGAAFLGEALASVRLQSRAVDECIVVDDGSSDASREIAHAAGALVLDAPPPGGPAAARNAGWRRARSDLIAFLDADDRWRPAHCALLEALLLAHPEAVLAFGAVEFTGLATGRFRAPLPTEVAVDARIESAITCPVPVMAVVVRRAALEAVGGFDERYHGVDDFDLFARLARVGPFIASSQVTAEYRQHATQMTRAKRHAMTIGCMDVRIRSLGALLADLSQEERAYAEGRVLDLWRLTVRDSWRAGARDTFDALLAGSDRIAGAAVEAHRWRRLARGWWAYHALRLVWQRLRVRKALDALARVRGPRATSAA